MKRLLLHFVALTLSIVLCVSVASAQDSASKSLSHTDVLSVITPNGAPVYLGNTSIIWHSFQLALLSGTCAGTGCVFAIDSSTTSQSWVAGGITTTSPVVSNFSSNPVESLATWVRVSVSAATVGTSVWAVTYNGYSVFNIPGGVTAVVGGTASAVNGIISGPNTALLVASAGAGVLVNDYSGTGVTVTTLALSSGTTVMTASTVDVQEVRCNNFTSTSKNLVMTDTAGNLFSGEVTGTLGFTVPAFGEDYPIPAGSHIRMVGIRMYASAANSINCVIYGKQ